MAQTVRVENPDDRTRIHFDGIAAHILDGIGSANGREKLGIEIRSLVDQVPREVQLADQYEKMVASTDRPSSGLLNRLNKAYEAKDKVLLNLLSVQLVALGVNGLRYVPGTQYLAVVVAEHIRVTRDAVLESLITQIKDKAPDKEKQMFLDGNFVDGVMRVYDAFADKAIETSTVHDVLEAKRLWTYRGTYLAHARTGHLSDRIAVHLKAGDDDRWTFYKWDPAARAAVVIEPPEVEHSELSSLGYDVMLVSGQYCLDNARLRDSAVFAHCRALEMQDFESEFAEPGASFGINRNIA